ncbi:prevent-host-death family protein [Streptomyces sp. Je 1-332]|uniref:prevent-host-death family protein n=1 Tax=Streptomyces sp. Je 1-332 TaxID=3231270 RepID=UPI0034589D14
MSLSRPEAVTFSDLSRNPKAVAERAARLGRLRVTHRDAQDFYLTEAGREDQRDQSLTTASRVFVALMRHDASVRALLLAIPEVFPWARHLEDPEVREFTVELVEALSDAAELDLDRNAAEVIAGWRATARIKADPAEHRAVAEATEGDFGPVDLPG